MQFPQRLRHLPPMGMRMQKTAVAVFLILILEPLLLKTNGFYGSIAAVICTRNHWKESYQAGLDRVLSTLIGGTVAWLLLEFCNAVSFPYNSLFYPLLLASTVLFVIYLTVVLERTNTAVLAAVVCLSITVNHVNDLSPAAFAIRRVLSTLLGIGMTVLIDRLLPNPKMEEKENEEESV